MAHIPYGYRIENGKAIVYEAKSEQIKILFPAYLSGDSLANAAKKACINTFHAEIGNILKNKRYVDDTFYPAIIDMDTFARVEMERTNRAEKLGRIREKKEIIELPPPTSFSIAEGNKQFNDPFKQAEYTYSQIETEVKVNGTQR